MTLSPHAVPARPQPPFSHDEIVARLEEAGRTLLALPATGPSTRLVQSGMEWVRDVAQTTTDGRTRIRPAVPPAAAITRMDEALGWIPLIPADKYVLRRVVGARSLVSPMTGRYLYSWRRLGVAVGADHKAVQRWHGQGIGLIAAVLRGAARASGADDRTHVAQPGRHHRGPQA